MHSNQYVDVSLLPRQYSFEAKPVMCCMTRLQLGITSTPLTHCSRLPP
jgi:hypothetical protein